MSRLFRLLKAALGDKVRADARQYLHGILAAVEGAVGP